METATATTVSIECNRERLIEVFQLAAEFAPPRSPKNILKHVCFEFGQNTADVMATDKETGCRLSLSGVVVSSPGSFMLPQRFLGLLNAMRSTTVRIEAGAQSVVLRGDRGEHRIEAIDATEFPVVAEFSGQSYLEVPGERFCELLKQTEFATDRENSRYALGGVLLEVDGPIVVGIATDGRRMSIVKCPSVVVGDGVPSDRQMIIPYRAMIGLEKVFGGDNAIRISTEDYTATFKGCRATVVTRMVEGRFPRWRDVLPHGDGFSTVDFQAGELLSIVSEASAFRNNEARGVDFVFTAGQLSLKYKSYDNGSSVVTVPCKRTGPDAAVLLDAVYVTEFLRVLDPSKNVVMRFKGDDNAVTFSTDDGTNYVVMQMCRDDM